MNKIKSFLTSNEYKNCYVIAFIIAFLICVAWKFKYESLQQENERLNTEIEKIIEMYKVEDDKTIRLDNLSIENRVLNDSIDKLLLLMELKNLRIETQKMLIEGQEIQIHMKNAMFQLYKL